MASSAAERRRLETPEKFERGVRRTALDADPPFTNPRRVRDVASRGSDGARPRDRLHFVHGGLEARRAGRRRRQPRRRRRENASLRGFLRDGVHRGGREEHAGRRVERARARAFAQRDIAQSCDHERERVRGGEQGRARGRVPARVRRRERVAEARTASGNGNASFVFLVSCPNLRRPGLGARRVREREVRREHARAKAPQSFVARSCLGDRGVRVRTERVREISLRAQEAPAAARLGARRETRQRRDHRRGFVVVRVERERAEPAPLQLFRRALAEPRDDRLEVLGENPERTQRPGHDAPGAGEARSVFAAKTSGERSRRLVQLVDDEPNSDTARAGVAVRVLDISLVLRGEQTRRRKTFETFEGVW